MKECNADFNNFSNRDLNYFHKLYLLNLNNFNNLIDKISTYNNCSPEWLTQTILSRNNYLSDIFFEYCKLEVLKKKLKKKTINYIYIKNDLQKKIINENFGSNFKIKFFLKNKEKTKNNFYIQIKNFIFNLRFSLILFKNKSKKRKKIFLQKEKLILIENFFYKKNFKKKKYQDRFYGKIINYLKDKEKKKIFFLFQNSNIFNLKKNIEVVEKYKINYITIFDFLNFTDYCDAIIKSQKNHWFFSKKIHFNGLNITLLFKNLYDQSRNDSNSFNGILQFLFFKRLKKEIDSKKILKVIDWYENQSLDKGFNLGLNSFFPSVSTLGYQPFAVDFDFYSHLIPTKKELFNKLTPNKIAMMGQKTKSYLIKKFKLNKKKIILSPSLRYEALFRDSTIKKFKKNKNILIALPISYQDSSDILKIFTNFVKKYNFRKVKFYINHHPMLDIQKLKKENLFLFKKVSLIKGSFNNIHMNIDCLISNASSICFEALALSKPVIIIKSLNSITQNPISMVKENIWKIASNEDELKTAISFLLFIKKKSSFINASKKIKNNYFSLVNKKNVIKFLGLGK